LLVLNGSQAVAFAGAVAKKKKKKKNEKKQ
jgi:hypothetical protein